MRREGRIKGGALACQTVQRRGAQEGVPVGTDAVVAVLVAVDQQNVGRAGEVEGCSLMVDSCWLIRRFAPRLVVS